MSIATPRHRHADNGAQIRRARKRIHLSQERFAAEVGTTRRHLIRLENGEHLPGGALRDRIADLAGQARDSIQSSDDEDEESGAMGSLDDFLRFRVRREFESLLIQHVNAEPAAIPAKATAGSDTTGG